jgi:hypothetical protein
MAFSKIDRPVYLAPTVKIPPFSSLLVPKMKLLPSPRHNFLYFILCGFGLILALAGLALLLAGWTTPSWPTTTGRILGSSVHQSASTKAPRTFSPELIYEYSVNGKPYVGGFTRIGGLSFSYEPNAEHYIKNKPPGTQVPVHYLPIFPTVAVIETGVSSSLWIFLGAGLAFFLAFRLLGGMRPRSQ